MHREISSKGEGTASFCIGCRVWCAHTHLDSLPPREVTAPYATHRTFTFQSGSWVPHPQRLEGAGLEFTAIRAENAKQNSAKHASPHRFSVDRAMPPTHSPQAPARCSRPPPSPAHKPLPSPRSPDQRSDTYSSAKYSALLQSHAPRLTLPARTAPPPAKSDSANDSDSGTNT